MVQLSKEQILEWQKTFTEDYGEEVSFAEADEAAHNLIGFFELLLEVDKRVNPHLYKRDKALNGSKTNETKGLGKRLDN